MRIVFMGTPDFAVTSLRALLEAGQNVVAVITAPDRPAGRGRKLQQSAVKKFALEKDLPVLQPTGLKSEDFLRELGQYQPDLQVVVAFRMLPEKVWKSPPKGTINLHASLLPQYRGAAPINRAIMNGEEKTGVTTFFINENIDTGDLIMQAPVSIEKDDTAGSLHDKLMHRGAQLLVETVQRIEQGTAPSKKQESRKTLKSAPKIFKEDTHIRFDQEVEKVYNFIRGLSPYPAAFTLLKQDSEEIPVKIFEVEMQKHAAPEEPGKVNTDNKNFLKIACRDGWIEVKSLQVAGKKRMTTAQLLNGFDFQIGAKFT